MRKLVFTLVALSSALLVAVLLSPMLVFVSVPTTFRCRAFIDASAEAKLEYPGGRRLSYQSNEGMRQLIELSSPQLPGFTAYLAIRPDDHDAFRWFDDHLQALGWRPLNPEARFQIVQSEGDTTRGSAEMIYLFRFEGDRIPPGITAKPPDGQVLLRYSYLIQDPAAIPACR
jgi:hypothetical protein